MNKIILILVLTILMSSLTYSQDLTRWTVTDYIFTFTFATGQVLDFGMSVYGTKNSDQIYEGNPTYGRNPNWKKVAIIKGSYTIIVVSCLAIFFKDTKLRRIILYGVNGITWIPVVWNIKTLKENGLRIGLSFSLR